jgi:4-amino-4-deoxy-L-arabinose transferase-like glycosyltransferase
MLFKENVSFRMNGTSAILVVFAVVLFVSLFRLGSILLFDVDEAVFAEATKEMVESGDYITTTYNGDVRYDKPIFFYWMMALSYKIFGINEFGARFPSALAGCLLAAAIFFFTRRFLGVTRALYSVLSMVLSAYYLVYSRSAVTDMVLTLFVTLSLLCFYLSLKYDRRYIYGYYSFSALAFLTKGLIGIVFPAAIALIYVLITEGVNGVRKLVHLKAAILFLIVGAPWYFAEYMIKGREFIDQFFIKHHFKRYTEVISGHKGPVYYYIVALIAGLFPWVAFLPAGIRKIIKDKDPLLLFSGVWVSFIVLFFSFATTKLPDYILSALPAASILIASGMEEEGRRWKRSAWCFIGFISAAAGIGFIIAPSFLARIGFAATDWMALTAAIALLMAVLSFYAAITARHLYAAMSSVIFAFMVTVILTALPVANNYLQGSLYEYSLYGKEKARPDERIIAYGINFPSIVFYSDHKVANVRGRDALQLYLRQHDDRIAIAKIKDLDVFNDTGFKVLKQGNRYALLERE